MVDLRPETGGSLGSDRRELPYAENRASMWLPVPEISASKRFFSSPAHRPNRKWAWSYDVTSR